MVNLFTKKVPERLSNIVKGVFSMVSAFPLAFMVYSFVYSLSWTRDSSGTLAIGLARIFFVFQFFYGIYLIIKKPDIT